MIEERKKKMGRLPVPMEFCQLQDTKPNVEGFIDPETGLLTLNGAEILAIHASVHKLRLSHQPCGLVMSVD